MAIGNSLYVVADRSVVEDIIRLATDKTHGRAREMLVATLGRFKTPETTRVLIELLDDADVAAHAAKALGKQKAAEARASDEQACKAPFDEVMYALTNYLEAFAMVGGARMSLRVQPQVTPYP